MKTFVYLYFQNYKGVFMDKQNFSSKRRNLYKIHPNQFNILYINFCVFGRNIDRRWALDLFKMLEQLLSNVCQFEILLNYFRKDVFRYCSSPICSGPTYLSKVSNGNVFAEDLIMFCNRFWRGEWRVYIWSGWLNCLNIVFSNINIFSYSFYLHVYLKGQIPLI